MKIGFLIDALGLVGDHRTVDVRDERRVRVHMDNRRHHTGIGHLKIRLDAERAFLKGPIGPHRHVVMHPAISAFDGDRFR